MPYAIYLKKSREDREAEARGEGETLARHRTALMELAKNRLLDIGAIYEEIVSGETIAARPKMQQLLEEVEDGKWDGVLVMEIERLARGNGIDQGIVSQAFSVSGTKIITPYKTYDPTNEMDEDYFEFGLFMSRREYQTIKRRLVSGRIASVKEGKYMGSIDPFGYRRVKLQGEKGWTLETVPEQAEIVQKIYQWYLDSSILQVQKKALAAEYTTSTGLAWQQANVMALLRNPIYCGYVTWGRKKSEKQMKNGKIIKKRKVVKDFVKARGRHEAIIPEDMWNAVQKKLDETPAVPIPKSKLMRNPYQGILYCACGHKMQLVSTTRTQRKGEPSTPYYGLHCPSVSCKMISSRVHAVDAAVMGAMREWISGYVSKNTNPSGVAEAQLDEIQSFISASEKELEKLDNRAFELVEQGIYTTEQFIRRRDDLQKRKTDRKEQIKDLESKRDKLQAAMSVEIDLVPQMEHVINAFPIATVEERKELLQSVFDRIEYRKELKPGQTIREAKIELTLYPRVPKCI